MTRVPILFVHWGDEGIRGSERVLLDLLATLNRKRFTPFLWCNRSSLADAARALDVGSEISEMPILLGWDAPRFDFGAYRKLVRSGQRLIRAHRIAVVHANSGAPNQWMVPAARRENVPVVAHLHALYKFRERCTLLLHQAPVIAGCSEAVVRPFRQDGFPEDRLRVVPNGVDTRRLSIGDAGKLRERLGLNSDSVLFVGAGALVPLKRFDMLIHALHKALDSGLDMHVALAGEGPERGNLESLASTLQLRGRVHFLGQVPNLGPILRDAADVAVISSEIESFGLTAAEAGAMGRPTVATNVGGIPELIRDGITGLLVPPGDVDAFSRAMVRLSGDPQLRARIAAAARDQTLSGFTIQRMTHSFEKLYDELLLMPDAGFKQSPLKFRIAPFARLGVEFIGRRLGVSAAEN